MFIIQYKGWIVKNDAAFVLLLINNLQGIQKINGMNRFGMFSWFGYPMPIEDKTDLIKRAGLMPRILALRRNL